jgi:hypothetical protein
MAVREHFQRVYDYGNMFTCGGLSQPGSLVFCFSQPLGRVGDNFCRPPAFAGVERSRAKSAATGQRVTSDAVNALQLPQPTPVPTGDSFEN